MRVLITGAHGFVGRYVCSELREHGHLPLALDSRPVDGGAGGIRVDIRDRLAVSEAVQSLRPDACVHLAALSYVPDGERDPERMLHVNVAGTVNLLDAMLSSAPVGAPCLLASSAHVYGGRSQSTELISERTPLRPESIYAISKAAAEIAAHGRNAADRLNLILVRPVNHTGPGQSTQFVVAGLVAQMVAIRQGSQDVLRVGNLDSERDFLDVRDVARAYRLLLECPSARGTYNLASEQLVSIRSVLDLVQELTELNPECRSDPSRLRPADRAPRLDTTRLRGQTGWRPRYSLRQTLGDMLEAAAP